MSTVDLLESFSVLLSHQPALCESNYRIHCKLLALCWLLISKCILETKGWFSFYMLNARFKMLQYIGRLLRCEKSLILQHVI